MIKINNDLVSIIIPIYNCENYIARCINSIINQKYKNIEIILVDDGSKDGSYEICKKFAEKDSRIKLFHKENGGVSSARNLGVNNATGKYVCFADGDDTIESNMIYDMNEKLIINNANMVICNYNVIVNDLIVKKDNNISEDMVITTREEFYKQINYFGGFLWNKMYETELVKKIRFDESVHYCEDQLFNVTYVEKLKSVKIYYDPNCLYNYYTYDNSASSLKNITEKKLTVIDANEKILNILGKYDFEVYKDYYIGYLFILNEIYHKSNKNKKYRKRLNEMYKNFINYSCVDNKIKLKAYLKFKFYVFYQMFSKIKSVLKNILIK